MFQLKSPNLQKSSSSSSLKRTSSQSKKINPQKLKKYNFGNIIGEGASATVYKAKLISKNQIVAIKQIPQRIIINDRRLRKLLETEAVVLKQCNNPNVVRYFERIRTKKKIYLIMQYCNGGDLQEYLENNGKIKESKAVIFLKEILNGFKGLHEVGAMHRDFKLSNVLLHNGVCKICDLGFAKKDDQQKMHYKEHSFVNSHPVSDTMLGTSITMAPQILEGKFYGFQIDIWSIGVVFYQLLYGRQPFYGQNDAEILQKIKKYDLKFSNKVEVSENAKDFIRQCLTYDPKLRITWKQIYDHPLINEDIRDSISQQSTLFNYDENKKFYEETVLIEKQISMTASLDFSDCLSSPCKTPKKQEEEIKQPTQIQIQMKYRRMIESQTFGYDYIENIKKMLPPEEINHHLPCFFVTKKVFLQLQNLGDRMDRQQNFLLFNQNDLKKFNKSQNFRNLRKQMNSKMNEVKVSCCLNKNKIEGLCPQVIKDELQINKIRSSNFDDLTRQILQDYCKMLIEHLASVSEPNKKQNLIHLILAVQHYINNENANPEKFKFELQAKKLQVLEQQILNDYIDS